VILHKACEVPVSIADYASTQPVSPHRGHVELDRSDLWPGLLERRYPGGWSAYGRREDASWRQVQFRLQGEDRATFEGELVDSLRQMDAAERARAGARWCDRNRPGWATLIDVEALDIADNATCIRGQLYGGHFSDEDIVASVGGPRDDDAEVIEAWDVAHGFEHRPTPAWLLRTVAEIRWVRADYAALTQAWRAEIAARVSR